MATKTMAETVALMGQRLENVGKIVDKTAATVESIEKTLAPIESHIKSIMGPPSLEDRVNAAMDQKDSHKHANVMQAITGVQTILTLQQENATLKLESNIGQLAKALETVAKSVEHTEQLRKENHTAQIEWQKSQEEQRVADKKEDAAWKRNIEMKLQKWLGIAIGAETVIIVVWKVLEFFKH